MSRRGAKAVPNRSCGSTDLLREAAFPLRVTSVELTDEAIARIEREDTVINAICVPDFDRPRAAAHRADQARARGEERPLLGIPVTVKESYDIAGLPTASSGASLRELMARIGHSSTRAAMIYQHATRDRDHAIAAALDALIVDARQEATA
jgi:hypothetical protein